jgi:hypothetical protein
MNGFGSIVGELIGDDHCVGFSGLDLVEPTSHRPYRHDEDGDDDQGDQDAIGRS